MTENLRKMREGLKRLERDKDLSTTSYDQVRVLLGLLDDVEDRYQSIAVALFEKGVVSL